MWLFYCLRRYFGSVHCFCGLKILIFNGSGLQIQTSGTTWNISRVGIQTNGTAWNISRVGGAESNIRWVGSGTPNGTARTSAGLGSMGLVNPSQQSKKFSQVDISHNKNQNMFRKKTTTNIQQDTAIDQLHVFLSICISFRSSRFLHLL